ncbi:hypothetical protein NDU88_004444 [Pleurodeles waltl]|uniref:Uncharacterized protein n=1 Tax=Pleurodeles waltl TaxID=8319 RepID=A0AAV7W856_PLEWA|nr:hypothetical protein NDU88_004444 [Pleurodeles waltl]
MHRLLVPAMPLGCDVSSGGPEACTRLRSLVGAAHTAWPPLRQTASAPQPAKPSWVNPRQGCLYYEAQPRLQDGQHRWSACPQ